MIKSLTLQNFQIHRGLKIRVSPGVNAIIGKSRRGKSSIVRALKWLVFNRPMGESFRRWGSSKTSVLVSFEDGSEVRRIRTDDQNWYDYNGETFRSFGHSPPEVIQEALKLGDLNFQHQHDPLFLLSMSPSEVGKVLNEVAGLDLIDETFSNIDSRIRRERSDLLIAKSSKESIELELCKYKDLDDLDKDTKRADNLNKDLQALTSKASLLNLLICSYKETTNSVNKYSKLPDLQQEKEVVDRAAVILRSISDKSATLRDIINKHNALGAKILRFKALDSLSRDFCSIKEKQASNTKIQDRVTALATCLSGLRELATQECYFGGRLAEKQAQFDKLMPSVCPLCGREVVGDDNKG